MRVQIITLLVLLTLAICSQVRQPNQVSFSEIPARTAKVLTEVKETVKAADLAKTEGIVKGLLSQIKMQPTLVQIRTPVAAQTKAKTDTKAKTTVKAKVAEKVKTTVKAQKTPTVAAQAKVVVAPVAAQTTVKKPVAA